MPPTKKLSTGETLIKISRTLAKKCGGLNFSPPVAAVYNPLEYAAASHTMYLELAGGGAKKVIFLGMNPGPWGMAQTGVPFGEIAAVRDWLGIEAPVKKPRREHPKRPIQGFACARSEVSGRRLWGLFRERFLRPEAFFAGHYVANYCPLVFMDAGGANITPDKLPAAESAPLFEACDRALADTISALKPRWVIGVGGFAKKRVDAVRRNFFADTGFTSAQILHPSPASPKANAGWAKEAAETLRGLGVWK